MDTIKNFLQKNIFLKNGSCPICGKVLFHGEGYCCEPCQRALPFNCGPTCRSCGRGLSDHQKTRCQHCRKENYPFSGGYAHFHYGQAAKKMVTALKFNNRPHLGSWLAESIDLKALAWIPEIELIMPIPIHEKRRRERGYNQSDYLAQGLLAQFPAPGRPQISQNLIRSRNTPHQMGQNQKRRRDNIHGAFNLGNPQAIENKTILLVDDVLTTGATLGEAAQTLIEGGAAKVYILVMAALRDS